MGHHASKENDCRTGDMETISVASFTGNPPYSIPPYSLPGQVRRIATTSRCGTWESSYSPQTSKGPG